jgi:hypothetical protein
MERWLSTVSTSEAGLALFTWRGREAGLCVLLKLITSSFHWSLIPGVSTTKVMHLKRKASSREVSNNWTASIARLTVNSFSLPFECLIQTLIVDFIKSHLFPFSVSLPCSKSLWVISTTVSSYSSKMGVSSREQVWEGPGDLCCVDVAGRSMRKKLHTWPVSSLTAHHSWLPIPKSDLISRKLFQKVSGKYWGGGNSWCGWHHFGVIPGSLDPETKGRKNCRFCVWNVDQAGTRMCLGNAVTKHRMAASLGPSVQWSSTPWLTLSSSSPQREAPEWETQAAQGQVPAQKKLMHGNSILSFLRKLHVAFHSGFTNLCFYQQCMRVLFSLHILTNICYCLCSWW